MIQITNEDNMELMARYPDNYFDLAIVDPPYGINVNESIGRRKGENIVDIKRLNGIMRYLQKIILMNYLE
jgi:site-specific DNA-methyltransferase (adenine-specific)